MADFFKAGKIPEVRKFFALLRLDGLHGAALAFQKNTRAVRLLLERQSAAIPAEAGELLDEIFITQLLERREPRDFLVGQPHLPRPATAGRATLTFEKNRHATDWLNAAVFENGLSRST